MGNGSSQGHRSSFRSSTSSYRRSSELTKKIDEKEYVFIVLQPEIKRVISQRDQKAINNLSSEIAAHIIDLNQYRKLDISYSERGRVQKTLHNFEIALASLKSVTTSQATFYTPDIVSNLTHNDSRRNSSSSQEPSQIVNSKPPTPTCQDIFRSVEDEFAFLKNKLERPIENVEEYFQMDKGIFYLQVQLNNLDLPADSTMNETKFRLLKELGEFRTMLDQKTGDFEEQQQLIQEVNRLELEFDSAVTQNDLESLNRRALLLQDTIERGIWDDIFIAKKFDALRQLGGILERIAYAIHPSSNEFVENKEDHLYGNLKSLQSERNSLIDKNDSIYGNLEAIRLNSADCRGTVYVNSDVIKENSFSQTTEKDQQQIINKPPLPLPRNYEEKLINDLPKHWQRLGRIFDNDKVSDLEKTEVLEIMKQAEIAKGLFERKIRKILEKCQESVDL